MHAYSFGLFLLNSSEKIITSLFSRNYLSGREKLIEKHPAQSKF